MEFAFQESFKLKEFFEENTEKFENTLLSEAVNVSQKINEILTFGNIDLVNNAHRLVAYIIEGKDKELQSFAEQEGIAWATYSIDLSFKLEWVQAIRRSLWNLIKRFNDLNSQKIENFFQLELEINSRVDEFLNVFFISYSTYKDSLIKAQRELVENLSVPIIPINPSVSILPLIGSIDKSRTFIIEEKVLTEVGKSGIQVLILDLSGIAEMGAEEISYLVKIITAISMMGCDTVITGLRKEVAKRVTQLGITFGPNTKTVGTMQQALNRYLIE
ncbi:STAS domain-containing protein [Aquibacillus saliphilus]|uniref:STAS domain-containing protein n=1 Tax=Aquibacillus saliphilus TaxID=1909422 RepID=UPI001CF03460|nr:STAS domain-containing protein [Aquibacillus saliphilus]